jgi:hypothetical protein
MSVEFIKPTVILDMDITNNILFPELVGKRVYVNEWDLQTKSEITKNNELTKKWKEFISYKEKNRDMKVGHLEDYQGNFLRFIFLREIINCKSYVSEDYLNTWTFSRPVETHRYYGIYNGIGFKTKGNHLTDWFSKTLIAENFNTTKVPQKLDDGGYITLLEDYKNAVKVNYGYEDGLIRHELKDVYCSKNGRYIKYKGKFFYIKEN